MCICDQMTTGCMRKRECKRERERNKMTSYTDSQTGLLRPKVTGKLKQR